MPVIALELTVVRVKVTVTVRVTVTGDDCGLPFDYALWWLKMIMLVIKLFKDMPGLCDAVGN